MTAKHKPVVVDKCPDWMHDAIQRLITPKPMKKDHPLRLTLRECVLLGLLCLSLGLCAFLAGEIKAYRQSIDRISHQVAPPFLHQLTNNPIKAYDD